MVLISFLIISTSGYRLTLVVQSCYETESEFATVGQFRVHEFILVFLTILNSIFSVE